MADDTTAHAYDEPFDPPLPRHAPGDQRISAIEAYFKRCITCIENDIPGCRHYAERLAVEKQLRMRIGVSIQEWMAYDATKKANWFTFGREAHPGASPIEVRLLQAFWDVGLDPVQQYKIAGYVVDFAFPRARLAVEADGKEFHRDADRERRRDEAIRRAGWHVVHFSGKVIWADADACVGEVYTLARSDLT